MKRYSKKDNKIEKVNFYINLKMTALPKWIHYLVMYNIFLITIFARLIRYQIKIAETCINSNVPSKLRNHIQAKIMLMHMNFENFS